MGIGDWIICTGQAKRLYEQNKVPVMVVNRFSRPQWNEVFHHNPRLTMNLSQPFQRLLNAPGNRPYIAEDNKARYRWKRFGIEPGELYFSTPELGFADPWRGHVLIEPNVKGTTSADNKTWPFERWQQVVWEMPWLPWLQVGAPGTRWLSGVRRLETPSFRLAAAVLSVCRAFVGSEGALHHAAAAVNVPAVVLFGGYISPDITGYAAHRNLFTGGEACGSRIACAHCHEAMRAITVEMVVDNLKEIL